MLEEDGPEAASLVGVGDVERDLGLVRGGAVEAGDADDLLAEGASPSSPPSVAPSPGGVPSAPAGVDATAMRATRSWWSTCVNRRRSRSDSRSMAAKNRK
ncbi:hypothetical protein GCM10025864_35220 [Luteimicrobium album]|uniref:Uncharacterized protein n=1 Tax=Luteimicrobium album TaxID=1054550 RepID=A0ABQ6I718_9MICO|nr:hypothetical protein GCM10025864_35220 [Luteimicrobium album]